MKFELQGSKHAITKNVGTLWAIGWLAEAAWQFAFVKNNRLSLLLSAILLVVACGAFQRALKRSYTITGVSMWARNLIIGVTSINAAWLTVATVVGILISIKASSRANVVLFALIGAIAIAAYGVHVTLSRRDAIYGATLVWSFTAVFMKQRGDYPAVAWTSAAAALAAATAAVLACVPDSQATQAAASADENVRQTLVDP